MPVTKADLMKLKHKFEEGERHNGNGKKAVDALLLKLTNEASKKTAPKAKK